MGEHSLQFAALVGSRKVSTPPMLAYGFFGLLMVRQARRNLWDVQKSRRSCVISRKIRV